jgi:hypothetical protein
LVWIYLLVSCTSRYLEALEGSIQGKNVRPVVVICHSHPVAAFVARWFGRRVRVVMISHGDIFHRPAGTYDPGVSWLYRQRRDLLEAMGEAALSRVAEFSWQSNVNSLQQAFERFSHC